MYNYSHHLFKALIALLLLSALIMFVLASRTFVQEREYHNNSLIRSTQATSREIELYIGGLSRALGIFAAEEYALMTRAVTQPNIIPALREKITLHFPEQLAFALSKSRAPITLVNEPELFGEHCRANLTVYSQSKEEIDTGLSIHSSGPDGTEHFDLMAAFDMPAHEEDRTGVIFISFGIEDLQRLLQSGSSSAYTLSLKNGNDNSLNQSDGFLLTAEVSGDENSVPITADYLMPVKGTPWILQGTLNAAETSRAWHASLIQTLIGTVILILAGLTAWRSIEQEKTSRNRTAIVLNSLESERKRIARELHDQALSDITHAKRILMELEPTDAPSDSNDTIKLRAAQQSVDDFSDIIRTAIDDLYPHALENLGLCKALESYIVKRCKDGPQLTLSLDQRVDTALDATQKLHLYRIISELINNALNHAECTKLLVSVSLSEESVVIRVEDNGKGFNSTNARKPDSHGIDNLESRAAIIDAAYQWMDHDTAGTCFELTIPINVDVTA